MASIAVILLNYNSTRLTKKCIASLHNSKDEQHEVHIVVWDNASKVPPETADFPDVDLVLSKSNDGFAEGNNKAAAFALKKYHCDYLLFLNNDTRTTAGMIDRLVATLEENPKAGMVVPKIYFERGYEFHKKSYEKKQRGHVIWYAGGSIDWNNVLAFHRGVDEIDRGQFDHALNMKPSIDGIRHVSDDGESEHAQSFVSETEFAAGTCFVIKASDWKKLHGFDKEYFLYYEDTDLSMRVKQKLHKIILFEPRALLYHQNAGSTQGSGSDTHVYYQTRNRLRFGLQYARMRAKLAILREAKRLYSSGSIMQRKAVLHALEGKWGKQNL